MKTKVNQHACESYYIYTTHEGAIIYRNIKSAFNYASGFEIVPKYSFFIKCIKGDGYYEFNNSGNRIVRKTNSISTFF